MSLFHAMRDGPKEKSPRGFFSMRRKPSVQERKPFVFQPSMLGTRIVPLTDEPRVSLHDRLMSPSRLQDRIDRCQEWSEAQGLSGDSERVEWTSSLRSQRSPSPIRSPYAMPDAVASTPMLKSQLEPPVKRPRVGDSRPIQALQRGPTISSFRSERIDLPTRARMDRPLPPLPVTETLRDSRDPSPTMTPIPRSPALLSPPPRSTSQLSATVDIGSEFTEFQWDALNFGGYSISSSTTPTAEHTPRLTSTLLPAPEIPTLSRQSSGARPPGNHPFLLWDNPSTLDLPDDNEQVVVPRALPPPPRPPRHHARAPPTPVPSPVNTRDEFETPKASTIPRPESVTPRQWTIKERNRRRCIHGHPGYSESSMDSHLTQLVTPATRISDRSAPSSVSSVYSSSGSYDDIAVVTNASINIVSRRGEPSAPPPSAFQGGLHGSRAKVTFVPLADDDEDRPRPKRSTSRQASSRVNPATITKSLDDLSLYPSTNFLAERHDNFKSEAQLSRRRSLLHKLTGDEAPGQYKENFRPVENRAVVSPEPDIDTRRASFTGLERRQISNELASQSMIFTSTTNRDVQDLLDGVWDQKLKEANEGVTFKGRMKFKAKLTVQRWKEGFGKGKKASC